jgi:hypothetical protein
MRGVDGVSQISPENTAAIFELYSGGVTSCRSPSSCEAGEITGCHLCCCTAFVRQTLPGYVCDVTLDEQERGYRGEGDEFAVDAAFEDDTGVEHDGQPEGKDIEIVGEAKGLDAAAQEDDDREDVAAEIEQHGQEAEAKRPRFRGCGRSSSELSLCAKWWARVSLTASQIAQRAKTRSQRTWASEKRSRRRSERGWRSTGSSRRLGM